MKERVMREIKFMAYEKAYNVIREVVSINFADKTVVLKDDFLMMLDC